jgi:hypothetical protein
MRSFQSLEAGVFSPAISLKIPRKDLDTWRNHSASKSWTWTADQRHPGAGAAAAETAITAAGMSSTRVAGETALRRESKVKACMKKGRMSRGASRCGGKEKGREKNSSHLGSGAVLWHSAVNSWICA